MMQAVTIDCGSTFSRCGFSGKFNDFSFVICGYLKEPGDELPRSIVPTIVGRPKNPGIMVGMDAKDCFFGDEAWAKRGILKLKYPIEQGIITTNSDMDEFWESQFRDQLRINSEEHPILMTEPFFNTKNQRVRTTVTFFEKMKIPKFYLAVGPVLGLYETGKINGLVVDCGGCKISSVPVYSGYPLRQSSVVSRFGGRDIDDYFLKLLSHAGYEMTFCASSRPASTRIKEAMGYVALDFRNEMKLSKETNRCEKHYEFPDGSKITLNDMRFRAPELLFDPSLVGFGDEFLGLNSLVRKSITKVDQDMKDIMYENILLTGGSSMFVGTKERLGKEVKEIISRFEVVRFNSRVSCPRNPKCGNWIGGSIVCSLSTFNDEWITKDEFDEFGPSIIERKCL